MYNNMRAAACVPAIKICARRASHTAHLFHVPLEALIVLQHLLCFLLAAPEALCEAVNVFLCHLLVQVSEVLVQVVKVFASQLL